MRYLPLTSTDRADMLADEGDDVVARLVDTGQRGNHEQRSGEQHRKCDTGDHRDTTIHGKQL